MRPGPLRLLRSRVIAGSEPAAGETGAVGPARVAAIDRKVPRAREDRTRLQPVKPADRMAEMGRVGIADILCEMRKVDVLIGEVQQMPRPFPGAEGTERDAGLLLEQV